MKSVQKRQEVEKLYLQSAIEVIILKKKGIEKTIIKWNIWSKKHE